MTAKELRELEAFIEKLVKDKSKKEEVIKAFKELFKIMHVDEKDIQELKNILS